MFKLLLFVFVFTFPLLTKAQSALSVEKIMQDPAKWIGTSPSSIQWDESSNAISFSWNPEQKPLEELYAYSLKDKSILALSIEQEKQLIGRGELNAAKTQKLYSKNNDLFLYTYKSNKSEKLISIDGGFSSPYFITDKLVGFSNGNAFYTLDIEHKNLQLLALFDEKSERPSKGEKRATLLEEQQKDLWLVLNERTEKEKLEKEKRELLKTETYSKIPKPKGRVRSMVANSNLSHIAFSSFQMAENSTETLVPHFVTKSGYVETEKARSKVGGAQSQMLLHIFSLDSNTLVQPKTAQLPGIKNQPAYYAEYPERAIIDSSKMEDRTVNVTAFHWSPNGDVLVAVILSDDNKDRWIVKVDLNTGDLTPIDHQHDEAWIGGPGIGGWSFSGGDLGWLPDGKNIWFQCEQSGYSHLYLANTETLELKQLTSGNFEVYDPFLSKDGKTFYFTANKVDPGIRHFYRMPISGGELVQLTSMTGNNEVSLSPDEKHLAILYSAANKPEELYLQANKPGAVAVKITKSTTPEWDAYPWRMPEFIQFTAQDGAQVPARLYQPTNDKKNGAAVIFVHGAGYLQNAHQWWSSYFREYQFHNLLTDLGYTVLDIDYRGSSGYGRDWRTGIYRHMGGKDLSDQVDGANYLINERSVSPGKIGIYGGSYGGFITLMAMFNHPDLFKAGAALRSVTDWAHYNHGYTENILNTPELDSIAYRKSSPIYFADGLEGHLLMCHGMVDDNVQFQDIVRLSQRLIELGKENWELAVYPVEEHGFKEPSSWTDEYKRILKLFETNLK